MGFAEANATEKDNVGLFFDKLHPEDVLNLETIDFLGPGPVKLIQGFDDREAGHANAALRGTITAQGRLPIGEFFQIGGNLISRLDWRRMGRTEDFAPSASVVRRGNVTFM